MKDLSNKIGNMGLVPVVVFDNVEDAIPTAKAMIDGGLPIMEIALRTKEAIPAMKLIKKEYPEIILGAGTVLSVDQAKKSLEAGCEFIVSPGFNDEVVQYCIDNNVLITPGCVTPCEIEHALSFGIDILKFFPASIYGGVNACKALHGPYRMIKFVPTGGVNINNLSDYADKEFIHAIGGGWLCSTKDIANGDFSKIRDTVKKSIDVLLGFELAHIGMNMDNKEVSLELSNELSAAFNLNVKQGNRSNFAGSLFEVMNTRFKGKNGHIAIRTNSIDRATYYLSKNGYAVNTSSLNEKNGKKIAVYLENEFGGFAIHLLQK